MAKRVGVDKWLFGTVIMLVLFGLVMVFSASAIMAQAKYNSPYTFVVKQAGWAALGLGALTVLMQIDYRKYNRPKVVFPAVAITMVLLLVVFAFHDSHHTHRWIRFGGFFTFQPSEIAKPALVLFLAWFLQDKVQHMQDWKRVLLPAAAPSLLFIALILKQPDLGTGLVCAGVTALMLYLAGMQMRYFSVGAVAAAPVLIYMLSVPWRRARIMAFLNPGSDPQGSGFHINQSLIAVSTGGLRGLGLMEGRQKLFFLPEAHTDFIFANIAEELGLLGAIVLVGLFVVLGYRGLRTAILSTDPFARFLAFGITATIMIQAFFNISVTLSLLPTKGITLPFISSGGTSLFIMLASIGVLLNISREVD
jgi:cell division protein FtsW